MVILLAPVIACVITAIAIPPIIRVSNAKGLFDEMDHRKVHVHKTPSLGGVAIFIGMIVSLLLINDGDAFHQLRYLLIGIVMMFFIGLKDDILIISPLKKFSVQLIAALVLVTIGDIRFTNLHGVLGIFELNYLWSVTVSLFLFIGITNAYNLIDGIDGLASGVALIASVVFGTWFYVAGFPEFAILSFALAGSLIAFSYFNVFSRKNKLFMGDSGSLIVGLIISGLIIQFNEYHLIPGPWNVKSAPLLSLAVTIVPVVDTLRVFFLRIARGFSPFHPDRNHIHHWLLILNRNHLKTTSIILLSNLLFILAGYLICQIPANVNFKLFILFVLGLAFASLPWYMVQVKNRARVKPAVSYQSTSEN